MSTHLQDVRNAWDLLDAQRAGNGVVIFDGENDALKLMHVVAVARYVYSYPPHLKAKEV